VVVDFGHGFDAAQAHGRAELVADDIDRLADETTGRPPPGSHSVMGFGTLIAF
jgi:hypothetical protein